MKKYAKYSILINCLMFLIIINLPFYFTAQAAEKAKTISSESKITIANALVTRDEQRIVTAYLPILSPGKSKGEMKPAINDCTPKGADQVFVILECLLEFPKESIQIDLKQNLFLIDSNGNKKLGYFFDDKHKLSDAKGNVVVGCWHPPGKITVKKPSNRIKLLYVLPENQTRNFKLSFLGNIYPLWPN